MKQWYSVALIAENEKSGYVQLTAEQAKLVAWATDPRNWQAVNAEPWSGYFCIDTKHPYNELPNR